MSIYQDEKDMQYMPDATVEAYKEGKGSKPDEQLLALLEQQKRLGLEADKQAEQNRPMPTVAQQVEQKAGLMDLQKMAQRLGMQITGMAPIGAPMMPQSAPMQGAPMMSPQGQPAPAGIAAAAPQMPQAGPAMPQAVAQGPAAPRPMAHGGIAHAAPSHMFKFAHGGGVLGFAGKEDSDVPAPRQETYAERDVRMHDQPALTSYQDPNSLGNIGAAIQSAGSSLVNALPAESGIKQIANWMNAGRPTLSQPLLDTLTQALSGSPQLQSTADTTPAALPPTGAGAGRGSINPPIPQAAPQAAPAAPVAQSAPVVPPAPAGLPQALPPAHPSKILAQTTPPGTVTGAPGVPSAQPNIFEEEVKKTMAEPDINKMIEQRHKLEKEFGADKPYGEETVQAANELREQMKEWNKHHAAEKLSALLTGIVSGGYAGGAPAAQANENEYRQAVINQYDKINNMLSPVMQQRRSEALAGVKDITTGMTEAQKEKSTTARTIFDRQLANQSSAELENIRQSGENQRSKLNRDTQIALKNMEINNPNRAPNANDIVKLLQNDPNYQGKSQAEMMQAAIEIQNGARSKQAQITALNDSAKILNAQIMDPMNTDENAKAAQRSQLAAIQKRFNELSGVETKEGIPLPANPSPSNLIKDKIYQTPTGLHKWTGTGFVPA